MTELRSDSIRQPVSDPVIDGNAGPEGQSISTSIWNLSELKNLLQQNFDRISAASNSPELNSLGFADMQIHSGPKRAGVIENGSIDNNPKLALEASAEAEKSLPDGSKLKFNSEGRVTQIDAQGQEPRKFKYDSAGSLIEYSWGNLTFTRQGDSDKWVNSQTGKVTEGGAWVDKDGNLILMHDIIPGVRRYRGKEVISPSGNIKEAKDYTTDMSGFNSEWQKNEIMCRQKLNTAEAELKNFNEAMEHWLKAEDREELKKHLEKFTERAKKENLPEAEVTGVIRELARLIEESQGKNKVGITIAKEIAEFAAEPTLVTQGMHGTCNVAVLEVLLYSKQPSKVAKTVADVYCSSGIVTSSDGRKVQTPLETLIPDAEAESVVRGGSSSQSPHDFHRNNVRGPSSHIFQSALMNLYFSSKDSHDGKKGTLSGQRYIAHEAKEETVQRKGDGSNLLSQERLAPGNSKIEAKNKFGGLDLDEIVEVYRLLTGDKRNDLMIALPGECKGQIEVKSEAELGQQLSQLKREGKLPVVLALPKHVVTIHDFDPVTGEIAWDNQWYRGDDHLGLPDTGAKLKLSKVFALMTGKAKLQ